MAENLFSHRSLIVFFTQKFVSNIIDTNFVSILSTSYIIFTATSTPEGSAKFVSASITLAEGFNMSISLL